MTNPVVYTPSYDFSDFQASNPTTPLPGTQVDIQLADISLSTTQIVAAIADVRRSDGAIKNDSVGLDQLKAEVGVGLNEPTLWATAHAYVVNDTVLVNAKMYICLVSHTSGTFATDLAAGDWLLIVDFPAALAPIVYQPIDTTGANIASASTTDLANATGSIVNITGSITITAFGTVATGREYTLVFAAAPLLTYNVTSLILPGGANIQTAAGDVAVMRSKGSGNWVCVGFQRAAALPLVPAAGVVTLPWIDAGATAGPTLDLFRDSASPASPDNMGEVDFSGRSSTGVKRTYAAFKAKITDATNASEDVQFSFFGIGNGVLNEVWRYSYSLAPGQLDIFANVTVGALSTVAGPIDIGNFSATGASEGWSIPSTGRFQQSGSSTGALSAQRFYNPNGQVGSIVTSGSATAFNTSSDERLKEHFADFDAGPIIDALKVGQFHWKADGTLGYGVLAQQADTVFPLAVTPGAGEPGDEDFQPMSVDYSKFVPLLLKEIQSLRARLEKAGL